MYPSSRGQISMKPYNFNQNQVSSIRSIRNSIVNSLVPEAKKNLAKGKTKSPTSWVNWTGESTPKSKVPLSSLKLPPISLEIKKSALSESKSEPILRNSDNFYEPRVRGSILLEQAPIINEHFRARGSILLENKEIPKEPKKNKEKPQEEEEKLVINSRPSIIQSEEKVLNIVTRCACKSQVGSMMGKKKKHNQDSWIIEQRLQGIKGQFLFTVCDGHGDKGHKVSGMIKKLVASYVESSLNLTINPKAKLPEAFSSGIQEMVSAVEDSDLEMKYNGSTMVSVLIRGKSLVCGNIGDSRAVIGRKHKERGWEAIELTNDHKPTREDEAKRVTLAGGVVRQYRMPNGDPVGPLRVWSSQKDNPGLAMTRSVGDLAAKKYGLCSEPEISSRKLSKRDKFLIMATDGIWEFITSQEAVEIVAKEWKKGKSEACCDKLIDVATEKWECESVVDDITALVAFLHVK